MQPLRRPWAIVVAGGTGVRFGGLKQLARIGNAQVLELAIESVRRSCAGVIVVLPLELVGEVEVGADLVIAGGKTRSASVRAGLAALPVDAETVLVHDGARPLASADLVARVVAGLASAEAVVPVIPVTDTLRHTNGGAVDRRDYVAVQTPQGFSVAALRAAHGAEQDATDDATLLDQLGAKVIHVEGDPRNLKITDPHDLLIAERLAEARDEVVS